MSELNYILSTFKMNLRELGALRLASLLQVILMMLNNIVFFVFWIIIYHEMESIRGLAIADVALIYAFAAGAFGVAIVIMGGITSMAESIYRGRLDVFLTQPRDVHLQTLMSKAVVSGWGDILSAFVLILFYWGASPLAWMVYLSALVTGSIIIVASISIFQSVIFWLPRGHSLTDKLTEFLITFMLYPNALFSGPVRAITYTLLPAGFISYFPYLVVRDIDPIWLVGAFVAALFYWQLSRYIFFKGIARYESGNSFVSVR